MRGCDVARRKYIPNAMGCHSLTVRHGWWAGVEGAGLTRNVHFRCLTLVLETEPVRKFK